jgi:hypothetical protein
LHKGSPEFKKQSKDETNLIVKSTGFSKLQSKGKLSCSSREFVFSEPKTNENISNNTVIMSRTAKVFQPRNADKSKEPEKQEEAEKSAEKIKLNKESRPFTKFKAEVKAEAAADFTKTFSPKLETSPEGESAPKSDTEQANLGRGKLGVKGFKLFRPKTVTPKLEPSLLSTKSKLFM